MGLFSIFPTFLAEAINLAPLATLGAGLAIIGAARGIGGIGERACEGIAQGNPVKA